MVVSVHGPLSATIDGFGLFNYLQTETSIVLKFFFLYDSQTNIAISLCNYPLHLFTDNLLCHDDRLEGRRVAFIYYLVSDWMNQDGGLSYNTCVDM